MIKLTYHAWYDLNEEELIIKAAETGADREADFDPEAFGKRNIR